MPTDPHPGGTVTARSVTRVHVAADRATIHVRMQRAAPTRAAAAAALRRDHDRLTRILTRFDSTVEHVTVTGSTLAEQSATDGEGWAGTVDVRVDVGAATATGSLVTALTRGRAPFTVSAPTWSLRPDHPAHAMVLRDAVRDASARAKAMAEAAGVTLGPITHLDSSPAPASDPGADPFTAPCGPPAVPVSPGPVLVTASVVLAHRIAPTP